MSRLAASSAANLANDLSHALDVAETSNAELLQRLEEAEAVIAKVRKVVGSGHGLLSEPEAKWLLDRLDRIDGL